MKCTFFSFAFSLLLSSSILAYELGIPRRKLATLNEPYLSHFVGFLGGGCTAVLLSPNLILTNLHCLVETFENDKNFVLRSDLGNFYSQMISGKSRVWARPLRAWYYGGTYSPLEQPDLDWALVSLDKSCDPVSSEKQKFLALPTSPTLPNSQLQAETQSENSESSKSISSFPVPRMMLLGYSADLDQGRSPSLDPYCP